MQSSQKRYKKYSQKVTIYKIMKIISFLLLMITLFLILSNLFVNLFLGNITTSKRYELKKPVSILLLGTDYGSDRGSNVSGVRSDSVMVVTLNPSNNREHIETNIVSIPRDTLVLSTCSNKADYYDKLTNTTNTGYIKNNDINEAIACTKASVENLLNIKIDYYIATAFQGVIDMINAVGTIKIDVPYEFCVQNEKDQGGDDCSKGSYHFYPGETEMDGAEALAYARQRHFSSDYERNIRQQQVIVTVVEKIVKNPKKYADDFITVFFKDFKSNLNTSKIWEFINFGTGLFNDTNARLAEDKPVMVDLKTSPNENSTNNISTSVNTKEVDSQNVTPVSISQYYDDNKIDEFEKDSYIQRILLTKEMANIATINQKEKAADLSTTSTPLVIEVSAYSAASSEVTINGGSYSYLDYDTLYYTSNLLRNSLNLDTEKPKFDYSAAGLEKDGSGLVQAATNSYYESSSNDYSSSTDTTTDYSYTNNNTTDTSSDTTDTSGDTTDTSGDTTDTGGDTTDTGGDTPDTGGDTPDTGGDTPDTGGDTTDTLSRRYIIKDSDISELKLFNLYNYIF